MIKSNTGIKSVRAPFTKFHRPGVLNNRNLNLAASSKRFITFARSPKSDSKVLRGLVSSVSVP